MKHIKIALFLFCLIFGLVPSAQENSEPSVDSLQSMDAETELNVSSIDKDKLFSTSAVVSTSVSVNGNTASGVDTTTPENIVIYGGWAGNIGECTSPSSGAICNSCIGTGAPNTVCPGGTNYACAERSIYDNLYLEISMALSALPSTTPTIYAEFTPSGSGTKTSIAVTGTSPTANNQVFTARISWTAICQKLGFANCSVTNSGLGELRVGLIDGAASELQAGNFQKFTVKFRGQIPTAANIISPPVHTEAELTTSDLGVNDFTMLPGDEKAYIRDILKDGVTPGNSSVGYWKSLRIYAAPNTGNFCDIDPSTSEQATLSFSDKTATETTLSKEFLEGLVNEQEYMFAGATIDDATIVQSFINPQTGTADQKLQYIATPGKVIGLLDSQKCFVATAAFGSAMDPHVQSLRNFRDQFLIKNYLGKKFIQFYYLNSTKWAKFIDKNPMLKPLVRSFLWPIVLVVELILRWGVSITFSMFVVIFIGILMALLRPEVFSLNVLRGRIKL